MENKKDRERELKKFTISPSFGKTEKVNSLHAIQCEMTGALEAQSTNTLYFNCI